VVCAVVNELETDSRNIRSKYGGIKEFKRAYQPRTNWVKGVKGDYNIPV
jgi:hypothetical protein